MGDVRRRTLLLGAGVLAGVAGSPLVGEGRARAQPDAGDGPDLALLRRTFALADEARQAGGAPYGALVADAEGKVIAEYRNTAGGKFRDSAGGGGGDPTQHAELVATTNAWRAVGTDAMNQATLYASSEPCSMCAGASYWNGIGSVVYGLSNLRLFDVSGVDPAHTSFALPCRDILCNGRRPVTVFGPLLEDEAALPLAGFFH